MPKNNYCNNCGEKTNIFFARCPHCGEDLRPPKRRPSSAARVIGTILGTMVIVVMVVLFPVYTDLLHGVSETEPAHVTSTAKEPTVKAEPSILGSWEISADSFEVTDSVSTSFLTAFKPDEGNAYVVVTLSIKNIGTEAATFLPIFAMNDDINAKIMYKDYEYTSSTLVGHSDDLHYKQMNPLTSATGIIAFQMPVEVANSDELVFVLSKGRSTLTVNLK